MLNRFDHRILVRDGGEEEFSEFGEMVDRYCPTFILAGTALVLFSLEIEAKKGGSMCATSRFPLDLGSSSSHECNTISTEIRRTFGVCTRSVMRKILAP